MLVASTFALLGACLNPDAGRPPPPIVATSIPARTGTERAKSTELHAESDQALEVEPTCVTPTAIDAGSVAASATIDWATLDAGTEAPHMIPNAAHVVSGMRHGFRACYQDQLRRDRDAAGTVRTTIRVGCDGSVVSVSATGDGLDKATVDCMIQVARGARFEPPTGGFAVIRVPVTFVKQ
jgi:hypothetical protein